MASEIEALQARMLRKRLWLVITRPVKPRDEVREHLQAHLEHQVRLEKAGILYGAGPTTACGAGPAPARGAGPVPAPPAGEPAFGLIIIRAADEAEARRIADSDPMHASGVRQYELYAWSLNEGRINVSLDFSDQTFRFD